jgi:hypothetical protein
MFPGESFGVAVSVAELHPRLPEYLPEHMDYRPMRLDEMLPSERLTDEELAREILRSEQVEAMVAAYKAERVAELAARRSSSADPRPGEPGVAAERDERLPEGVSKFFPDELAMILNCSRTRATLLTETSQTLLPGTRPTALGGSLPAQPRPAALGEDARQDVPAPRLRQRCGLGGPRPRRLPAEGGDRLRQRD